jgi:hypothetical protein
VFERARRQDGQTIIVPLRALPHLQQLELFVPQIVIEECTMMWWPLGQCPALGG